MRKLLIITLFLLNTFILPAFAYEVGQPLGKPAPSSPEYEKFTKEKTLLENAKIKIEADLQRISSEDVIYMKSMMEADRERDMWNEIEKHIISVEKAEPHMEIYNGARIMWYEKRQENSDGSYYFITKNYRISAHSEICQSYVEGHVSMGADACDGIHPLDLNAEALIKYVSPFPGKAKTPIEYFEYFIGAKLRKEAGRYVIERTYDYYFAERAGLKPGDIILTIDNIPVNEANFNMGLADYIYQMLEFSIKIIVRRGDKEITVYRKW